MVKQPFNRSLSGPRNAVIHFLNLLGNVNMHWRVGQQLCCKCQLIRGDSTQTVRRHAKHSPIKTGKRPLAALDQARKTLLIVDETALSLIGIGTAKTRMCIKHRQQGQTDASSLRCRDNAVRHFRDIAVRRAVAIMMQIMKLTNAGKPGFQHIDIKPQCDCFRLFRRHGQRELIHDLAPAPETVSRWAAPFSKASHAILKRVAVEVWHPRYDHLIALVSRFGFNANLHRSNFSLS